MKEIFIKFDRFDGEGIIKKEIRHKLRSIWDQYQENFLTEWNFVLDVWPDIEREIKISSHADFIRLVSLLDSNCLPKSFLTSCISVSQSVMKEVLEVDPDLFFHFECIHRSGGNYKWILNLLAFFHSDYPEKLISMLNSLLQYFERIESTQAQMFKRQKDQLSLDVDV